MDTIINVPRHIKAYTAALALAALVITLLAVSFSAGPTQAQNATNTYDSPVPCGDTPGTGTASMDEPHEVTTGHFALFDAYWERTGDDLDEGAIHINDCPPKMVQKTETDPDDGTQTVSTVRAASAIDVGEAIMHVLDKHQATVINSASPDYVPGAVDGPTIDLKEYPDVGEAASVGDKVWWLQLDDPDTDADETSDLRIGFSAALFDEKYWLKRDNEPPAPMRWMLEAVSYRNVDDANPPHFFAYEAPLAGGAEQEYAVWDSFRPDIDTQDMTLDPGEYRALQWIFTGEGSYTIQSQFQGFVRQEDDKPSDAGEDWEPVSSEYDETSAIRDYVFQVGDGLDETEPPIFGVSRSVHEDASGGAHVGEPVRVFGAEVETLTYKLSGDDSGKFSVTSRTHPFAAQIVVAANANLDYDTKSSYDLVLEVSDGKDHEGNNDSSADHSIAVQIEVVQQPHAYIIASSHTPAVGQSVTLSVNVWDLPGGVTDSNLSYTVWEASSTGRVLAGLFPVTDPSSYEGVTTASKDSAGTYKYTPTATYTLNGVEHTLHGDPVTVTWRNP